MRTVQALGGVGIFGVEMFLTHEGELLVNTVHQSAPRLIPQYSMSVTARRTHRVLQHSG